MSEIFPVCHELESPLRYEMFDIRSELFAMDINGDHRT
jgi:hypothetical protein